eukprot:NODE_537_length_7002_cov_0.281762.p3 type:complete len:225 gc:universal NODE_537_length_7002_cov_0.281762:5709-6383(+)
MKRVKALYPFTARHPEEVSFAKGQEFFVLFVKQGWNFVSTNASSPFSRKARTGYVPGNYFLEVQMNGLPLLNSGNPCMNQDIVPYLKNKNAIYSPIKTRLRGSVCMVNLNQGSEYLQVELEDELQIMGIADYNLGLVYAKKVDSFDIKVIHLNNIKCLDTFTNLPLVGFDQLVEFEKKLKHSKGYQKLDTTAKRYSSPIGSTGLKLLDPIRPSKRSSVSSTPAC